MESSVQYFADGTSLKTCAIFIRSSLLRHGEQVAMNSRDIVVAIVCLNRSAYPMDFIYMTGYHYYALARLFISWISDMTGYYYGRLWYVRIPGITISIGSRLTGMYILSSGLRR